MQNKLKLFWMCESAGSMEMLPRLKKLRRKRQMQIIRNRYINDGQFWGSSLLALSVSNGTCHQFVYARLHTTLLHLRLEGYKNICRPAQDEEEAYSCDDIDVRNKSWYTLTTLPFSWSQVWKKGPPKLAKNSPLNANFSHFLGNFDPPKSPI